MSLLELLHRTDGPLTEQLRLRPGGFGLSQLPLRGVPQAVTSSVCGFCSTGCSLNVHLQNGEAVGLSPQTEYPVNLGMACPKGWEALTVLKAADRATTPLLRDSSGRLQPVDWPAALRTFVTRFKAVQAAHGPESVAFLGTGQMPTEELAYLGALAKFGMGLKHGDGNTRQCMATAVVAYKQSFGFDAPPYTYADLEQSDTVVLVGSNLCLAHPILWERFLRNRHSPRLIVIDPRRTESAMAARLHLPVKLKSDLDLFYGLARELLHRGAVNHQFIAEHTTGFDEFAAFVEAYTPVHVSRQTGLSHEALQQFADLIQSGERVSFWWTMGVNQSHQGVRTAQAIINVALMTGNIGRPGTGANSLTGQCNAMGSRLFANTTTLLGGRDFRNPAHRREVATVIGIPEDRVPVEPGWAYPEIMEGILRGAIRGLWVVCTNPAHSWINQDFAKDVLSRLDFLVVQDMYHSTETAQLAHLVLPAAGWGEKEGTFINSERRIGVIRKVARAPGVALADFSIFRLIAEAWGCGDDFLKWSSPADVFQILKKLSAGRPCDFSGIGDYEHLSAAGGIQWPYPAAPAAQYGGEVASMSAQERRLFADGRFYHPDGRARFEFEAGRPLPEVVNERFPLQLNTGRGTAVQWHTGTRTSKSAVLRKLAPLRLYAELNPVDARRLGVAAQETILIASRRGQVRATAVLTPAVPEGQIFLPMHYNATNRLTDAVFDPYSRQPAYKACAVRVERVTRPD